MQPATSDSGFFQDPPVLENQYYDDVAFQRTLNFFVPKHFIDDTRPEISQLGRDVISPQVFAWVSDAEKNTPYLKGSGRDAFGLHTSELVTGEGWRRLQAFGQTRGFVAYGYANKRGPFDRVLQFLRLHLWEGSTANVTCPSAMQDGAARLLRKHLAGSALQPDERRVFQNALDHLTSRDAEYAWTSGQWMTERSGGSDVSQTETIARPYIPEQAPAPGGDKSQAPSPQASTTTSTPTQVQAPELACAKENIPLGPWAVSGFKWFTSATDSQMTILLAYTADSSSPTTGLSAFLAPMRRDPASTVAKSTAPKPSVTNGVRISRLKNKMGTKPLPTAEIELRNMRAWLIGTEGRGIEEMASVLAVTRVHSAVAAVGYLGRGLAVARAYARVRIISVAAPNMPHKRKKIVLAESPLHMNTLADMTSEYQGLLLLTMFCAYVLGLDEHPMSAVEAATQNPLLSSLTPPADLVAPLLRVLTQLTKAYVCKNAIPALYACMEALGGIGYMHNDDAEFLNISRIYRDCCVLAIWEGTTDVLAADFVRALKHPQTGHAAVQALDYVINTSWERVCDTWDVEYRPVVAWEDVKRTLDKASAPTLAAKARVLLFDTAEALITLLLKMAAMAEKLSAANDIFMRFVVNKRLICDDGLTVLSGSEQLARDQTVVYGSIVHADIEAKL